MTTYYMQDKHDHYRYTRISKPRAYWEWLTYAVEWLVCWHEINPCTFHHFGWRFWQLGALLGLLRGDGRRRYCGAVLS